MNLIIDLNISSIFTGSPSHMAIGEISKVSNRKRL